VIQVCMIGGPRKLSKSFLYNTCFSSLIVHSSLGFFLPVPVFRTVQGPQRDDMDNAKKTGREGTASRGPVYHRSNYSGDCGWDLRALYARHLLV